MLLGLQTIVESRPPIGAVGHQLVLKDKNQSQLGHLPSHFHRSEKESTLSMLLDHRIAEGFPFLEDFIQKDVL